MYHEAYAYPVFVHYGLSARYPATLASVTFHPPRRHLQLFPPFMAAPIHNALHCQPIYIDIDRVLKRRFDKWIKLPRDCRLESSFCLENTVSLLVYLRILVTTNLRLISKGLSPFHMTKISVSSFEISHIVYQKTKSHHDRACHPAQRNLLRTGVQTAESQRHRNGVLLKPFSRIMNFAVHSWVRSSIAMSIT